VKKALGIDTAPDTSETIPNLSLVQGNLNEALPLPDAYADVVVSLAVIEHLTDPEIHTLEAYRILKPGGVLLLTTPSPRAKPILEFLAFRLGVIDRFEIEDHKHYFNTSELRTVLESAGFKPENLKVSLFQFGFNTFVVARK
jgi:SAM-dependent methyltransferase